MINPDDKKKTTKQAQRTQVNPLLSLSDMMSASTEKIVSTIENSTVSLSKSIESAYTTKSKPKTEVHSVQNIGKVLSEYSQQINELITIDPKKSNEFLNIVSMLSGMNSIMQGKPYDMYINGRLFSIVPHKDNNYLSNISVELTKFMNELNGIPSIDSVLNRLFTVKEFDASKLVDSISNIMSSISKLSEIDQKKVNESILSVIKILSSIRLLISGKFIESIEPTLTRLSTSLRKFYTDIQPKDELVRSLYSLSTSLNIIAESFDKFSKVNVGFIAKVFMTLGSAVSYVSTRIEASSAKLSIGLESLANAINVFVSKVDSRSLMQIAGAMSSLSKGLALFGLAVFAFGLLTVSGTIFIAAAGIMALGLALRFVGDRRGPVMSSLLTFTLSLATLGIAIWAFGEVVTAESMFKTILGIGLLAGALYLFSGRGGGKLAGKLGIEVGGVFPGREILFAAVGIAALGLAMYVWNKVKFSTAIVASIGIAGVGLAMRLWGKIPLMAPIALAASAIGLIGIGLAMNLMPDNVGLYVQTGIFIFTLAGAMFLMGNPIVLLGAAALVLVGVGLVALGAGMLIISALPDMKSGVENLKVGLESLAEVFIYIGNPKVAIPVGIGAIAAIAMSISGSVAAMSLALISALPYDPTRLQEFNTSLRYLVSTYTGIPMKDWLEGTIKATLAVPIALSGVATSLTLALISVLNYKPEKIEQFGKSLGALVESYDEFGLIQLTKAAAKSVLMMPIAIASLMVAGSLRLIQALDMNPTKASLAAESIGTFVTSIVKVMDENKNMMEAAKDGIEAFAEIGSMVKGIADGVYAIGNLEFIETKVVNGKIVPVSTRKMTPEDFTKIGMSIGQIVQSITGPLAEIGSQKDEISIAGLKITNPFSSKVEKGIEAVSNIGNVLMPLAEVIKAYNEAGFNETGVTQFNTNIASILNNLGDVFMKLSENEALQDSDVLQGAIENLNKSFETLQNVGIDKFSEASDKIEKLIKTANDPGNFKTFADFAKGLAINSLIVKGAINSIDMSKLIAFKEITKNLLLANNNDQLAKLIEQIISLISKMEVTQQLIKSSEIRESRTESVSKSPTDTKKVDDKKTMVQEGKFDDTKIVKSLDEVRAELEDISGILLGTLKVKQMM